MLLLRWPLSLWEVIIHFDISGIVDRQFKLSVHNISRIRVRTAINLLLNGQPLTFTVPTDFQKNYYFTNCHTISTDMVFLARSCHSISSYIVILTRGTLMLNSFYITRSTTWNMNVLVLYLITSSIKCRHVTYDVRYVRYYMYMYITKHQSHRHVETRL